MLPGMWELRVKLNEAEKAKLEALAAAKRTSVEDCVRAWIAACQPGGSGWKHPEEAGNPRKPTT